MADTDASREPLLSELANRYDLTGVEVINKVTGTVENTIVFTRDETDFPGYVESVESGYKGTEWVTRRVWSNDAP